MGSYQAGNYSGCIMGNVGSATKSQQISGLCYFMLCESVVLNFQNSLFLCAEFLFIDELFGLSNVKKSLFNQKCFS